MKSQKNTEIEFGLFIPITHLPLNNLIQNAIFAEKAGFDSIWIGDHLVGIRTPQAIEPWTLMTVIAMKTKKIKIGLSVADPHKRHPAVLAQAGMSLDIISNGRLILGVGAGEAMNLDPYGIPWDKPFSRLRETIEVVKKLWTEEAVNYAGKFYKLKQAFIRPKPVQKPHPPIWIDGNSPITMKMVAEYGDGWIPLLLSPELYREDLARISKWAENIGRSIEEIEPAYFLYCAVSKDQQLARKTMEDHGKRLALLFPKKLRRLGYKVPTTDFSSSNWVYTTEGAKALARKSKGVSSEPLKNCCAFGTPDQFIDMIEKYIKAGTRHFVIDHMGPINVIDEGWALISKKVIPYFRQ